MLVFSCCDDDGGKTEDHLIGAEKKLFVPFHEATLS